MASIVIWGIIIGILLAIYSTYRDMKKRNQYEKKFEEVCNENIIVVDRILYELEINKKAETKMKVLLKTTKDDGETKDEKSDISDEC